MNSIGKSLAIVLMAGATVLSSALSDGTVTTAEKITIAIAVTMAISTYVVPNLTTFPYGKTIVNAVLAGLNLVSQLLLTNAHLSSAMWINVGITVVGVLVAYQIPGPQHVVAAPPVPPAAA